MSVPDLLCSGTGAEADAWPDVLEAAAARLECGEAWAGTTDSMTPGGIGSPCGRLAR